MSELDAVHLPPSHASGDDSAIASSSTHPAQPSGPSGGDEIDEDDDDAELEAMKARVAEMEAEAAKLREMQEQAEREAGGSSGGGGKGSGATQVAGPTDGEKGEVDARSVYVGNVSLRWRWKEGGVEMKERLLTQDLGARRFAYSHRSTTEPHQRRSSNISLAVGTLIVLRFSAISLLVIQKGEAMMNCSPLPRLKLTMSLKLLLTVTHMLSLRTPVLSRPRQV